MSVTGTMDKRVHENVMLCVCFCFVQSANRQAVGTEGRSCREKTHRTDPSFRLLSQMRLRCISCIGGRPSSRSSLSCVFGAGPNPSLPIFLIEFTYRATNSKPRGHRLGRGKRSLIQEGEVGSHTTAMRSYLGIVLRRNVRILEEMAKHCCHYPYHIGHPRAVHVRKWNKLDAYGPDGNALEDLSCC